MIYTLQATLEFEAESEDQALLKIANFFLEQMAHHPSLSFANPEDLTPESEVDLYKILSMITPHINEGKTQGGIFFGPKPDFGPPQMLQ